MQTKSLQEALSISYDNIFTINNIRTDLWNKIVKTAKEIDNENKNEREVFYRLDELFDSVMDIEKLHAYPGTRAINNLKELLKQKKLESFTSLATQLSFSIISNQQNVDFDHSREELNDETFPDDAPKKPYFEVLVVASGDKELINKEIRLLESQRRKEDKFNYRVVIVDNYQDAFCAIAANSKILSVIVYDGISYKSQSELKILDNVISLLDIEIDHANLELDLAKELKLFRPELDIYLLSVRLPEEIISDIRSQYIKRVLYAVEEPLELHLSILENIGIKYRTPFFENLKRYAYKPISTFHALPIARGKSIFKSGWISDMGDFYGRNLFLAESSATTGGLDSLLEPTGNIKEAQEKAAKAFNAEHCFFITNGTSTSNKIVLMAIAKPGDIIIVDRNCHKSHHYGMVLGGLLPYYVEAFPMEKYSMYGAVPLINIKKALLTLKSEGKLEKVRAVDLTNCTFDGHVYNTVQFMRECLAIKPDLVFLWDEAWFGFARWTPFLRMRTAMGGAEIIDKWMASPNAEKEYLDQQAMLGENPSMETLLETKLIPNPKEIRLRVYQTNSTHKSMSALRQGSMILVKDIEFESIEPQLHEAIFTHSTTSPNQQLIASLDLARRQMELEGYGLVANAIHVALEIRKQVNHHPLISKYFTILPLSEMIPEEYRKSGFTDFINDNVNWDDALLSIKNDEFFLDPTRMTLVCGNAGFDGTSFKNLLANKFNIQVNKTSRNSVLLQSNINNTRSDVGNLLGVLNKIALEIEKTSLHSTVHEKELFEKKVHNLMNDVPALPNFSHFDASLRNDVNGNIAVEGNIREAFFISWDVNQCEYIPLFSKECDERLQNGPEMISAKMVIPYPPGFPILVPGQVISKEIIEFMRKLDVKEVHGYEASKGLQLIKK